MEVERRKDGRAYRHWSHRPSLSDEVREEGVGDQVTDTDRWVDGRAPAMTNNLDGNYSTVSVALPPLKQLP
uniref:Uncharacterized protein n=1 Tax=Setaria digitata TaxID=48799 RepID=A0A915PLR7_9BILA